MHAPATIALVLGAALSHAVPLVQPRQEQGAGQRLAGPDPVDIFRRDVIIDGELYRRVDTPRSSNATRRQELVDNTGDVLIEDGDFIIDGDDVIIEDFVLPRSSNATSREELVDDLVDTGNGVGEIPDLPPVPTAAPRLEDVIALLAARQSASGWGSNDGGESDGGWWVNDPAATAEGGSGGAIITIAGRAASPTPAPRLEDAIIALIAARQSEGGEGGAVPTTEGGGGGGPEPTSEGGSGGGAVPTSEGGSGGGGGVGTVAGRAPAHPTPAPRHEDAIVALIAARQNVSDPEVSAGGDDTWALLGRGPAHPTPAPVVVVPAIDDVNDVVDVDIDIAAYLDAVAEHERRQEVGILPDLGGAPSASADPPTLPGTVVVIRQDEQAKVPGQVPDAPFDKRAAAAPAPAVNIDIDAAAYLDAVAEIEQRQSPSTSPDVEGLPAPSLELPSAPETGVVGPSVIVERQVNETVSRDRELTTRQDDNNTNLIMVQARLVTTDGGQTWAAAPGDETFVIIEAPGATGGDGNSVEGRAARVFVA